MPVEQDKETKWKKGGINTKKNKFEFQLGIQILRNLTILVSAL